MHIEKPGEFEKYLSVDTTLHSLCIDNRKTKPGKIPIQMAVNSSQTAHALSSGLCIRTDSVRRNTRRELPLGFAPSTAM